MEAKELRIGNVVMLDREGIVTVDAINRSSNKHGYRRVAFTINGKFISRVLEHKINPIPLKEEWLVKFGFKKENNSYWVHRYLDLARHPTMSGSEMIMVSNSKYALHLKHVHQLQNLYFALTGQELTIKE